VVVEWRGQRLDHEGHLDGPLQCVMFVLRCVAMESRIVLGASRLYCMCWGAQTFARHSGANKRVRVLEHSGRS
jgi:hypothetical protein